LQIPVTEGLASDGRLAVTEGLGDALNAKKKIGGWHRKRHFIYQPDALVGAKQGAAGPVVRRWVHAVGRNPWANSRCKESPTRKLYHEPPFHQNLALEYSSSS
jgi:hypothetical protein